MKNDMLGDNDGGGVCSVQEMPDANSRNAKGQAPCLNTRRIVIVPSRCSWRAGSSWSLVQGST